MDIYTGDCFNKTENKTRNKYDEDMYGLSWENGVTIQKQGLMGGGGYIWSRICMKYL